MITCFDAYVLTVPDEDTVTLKTSPAFSIETTLEFSKTGKLFFLMDSSSEEKNCGAVAKPLGSLGIKSIPATLLNLLRVFTRNESHLCDRQDSPTFPLSKTTCVRPCFCR